MNPRSGFKSQSSSPARSQVLADHLARSDIASGSSGYFTDYLERMSIDEQRKIKEELQDGYRPGKYDGHNINIIAIAPIVLILILVIDRKSGGIFDFGCLIMIL